MIEIKNRKIVIIGAGHVGSQCALSLIFSKAADEIVFIDIDEKKARSQALDLEDLLSNTAFKTIMRSGSYEDCTDASIVVMAAGQPRLPGQTRLDLFESSVKIANEIGPRLKSSGFNGILISISNPADIIGNHLRKLIGFDRMRAFSTGTLLDSYRLRGELSSALGVDRQSINGFVMGEHGDSQFVPFSNVSVCGIPLNDFTDTLSFEEIENQTAMRGMKIVQGKNSTEFGIGLALCEIVEAVFNDQKRVMPLSVCLNGEFGIENVPLGVPCVIGKGGIERIIEIKLNDEETKKLNNSAGIVSAFVKRADEI